METLPKFTNKHPNFLSFHHHIPFFSTPISSISFRSPISHHFKLKITSSSSHSKPPKTLIPSLSPFSLLKTPLCIAVAAAAVFFSRFPHSPMLAVASPASAPAVETGTKTSEYEAVSDEEKEKALEEYVNSNPNDVQALKSLMEVKIRNKKLQEAIEVVNRLIEVEPDDYEWPLLRAHMYSYTGESELARVGFEEILAKDPLRVEAYHGLVMAVGDSDGKELEGVTKRIEEAMEMCKREKRKDDVRDFKLLIAQIRVIEGNYMEALKVYQELVKEEPRDFRPYLCQGIIYTLLRKKDEADKQFEKYKRLVPKGHPYARYFDENMLATKVFSQMAENERAKAGKS